MTDFVVAQGVSGSPSTTAASNSSWYIKFNSGLCIVGGSTTVARTANPQSVTVAFPFTVKTDTAAGYAASAFHTGDTTVSVQYSTITTTGIQAWIPTGTSAGFIKLSVVAICKWK